MGVDYELEVGDVRLSPSGVVVGGLIAEFVGLSRGELGQKLKGIHVLEAISDQVSLQARVVGYEVLQSVAENRAYLFLIDSFDIDKFAVLDGTTVRLKG